MEVSFISKNEFGQIAADYLKKQLELLLESCHFSSKEIAKIEANLWERHLEKQRHYHDLSHLYNLYLLKNKYAAFLKNPLLIEAAIWFHDAIYHPKKKDNETKSAEFAVAIFQGKTLPFDLHDLKLLIESTAKHQSLKDDSDFHYFLDFDLGILATEPAMYQKYVVAIREEYSMYPNLLYKMGRKKVLESFLERERIYFSEVFFEGFEEWARRNILAEMNDEK